MTSQTRATRRLRRGLFAVCAIAVASITVTLGVTVVTTAAYADNYPSWSDVQNARNNESAKQAQIAQIQDLITGLQGQVAAAKAAAQRAWNDNNAAQQALSDGTFRAQQLELQATQAKAKADASRKQAAALAAQLARSGGNDVTAQIIGSKDGGSGLLYQLGAMSKLSETSKGILDQANQDANTAQSLTDQAEVAKDELTALAAAAQNSLNQATAAQAQVAKALGEQEGHQVELTVQLQALTSDRQMTEEQYNAGVAAERQRQLAEEQAAAAAAAAAAANNNNNNSGGGGTSDNGGSSGGGGGGPVFNTPPQSTDGQAIVDYAMQFVGVVPYGWGADPSDSFGCDGLTQYVYKMVAGIYLPRLVSNQIAMGVQVSRANARPGDLVAWPGHIGIYAGNGMVIHSPDWGRYVTYAGIWGSPSYYRIL